MATEYFRQSFSTILISLNPIHKSKENKVYKPLDESVDYIQMQTFSDVSVDYIQMQTFSDDYVDDEEVINTKTESVHQRKNSNPSSSQTINPAYISKYLETLDKAKEQLQQRENYQRNQIVAGGLALFSVLTVAALFIAPPITIVAFFVTAAMIISVAGLHEKYYAQQISELENKSKELKILQPSDPNKTVTQTEQTAYRYSKESEVPFTNSLFHRIASDLNEKFEKIASSLRFSM